MDASLTYAVENILLQKTKKTVTSLSAHNSPVSNKRHRLNVSTASLTSCSSQINNNYANLDMDSLEDMLRKVCMIFKKKKKVSILLFVLLSFILLMVYFYESFCIIATTSSSYLLYYV